MPWFKIDDGFHCHPKVFAAGNAALGLWARLGAYCSDQLTDGFVPDAIAKGYGTRAELTRLVTVNMIEQGDHPQYGAGYWLHDYHDYNPTAEKVRADRADAAERQRKSRERRDEQRRESQETSQRDDSPRRGVTHTTPTRPDPTRPKKKPSHPQDESTRAAPPPEEVKASVANLAARLRL